MTLLGIAASRSGLRAVAVRRGRVVWAAARDGCGVDALARTLSELAGERPTGVRTASVAVEGEFCQIKLLTGLPRLRPSRLSQAVALQSSRWFLRNGGTLNAAAIPHGQDGVALAAASESETLGAIADGLDAAGLQLVSVTPGAIAVAATLADGTHDRLIDGRHEKLTVAGHALVEFRREFINGTCVSTPAPRVPGLDESDALLYAAYVAAIGKPRLTLAVPRLQAGRAARTRAIAIRLGLLAALFWFGAAVTLVTRVERAAARVREELRVLDPSLEQAFAAQRELNKATHLIDAMARIVAQRSDDAGLLKLLSDALPDSAYLVAIRRDAKNGVVIAGLAPSASRVVALLEKAPGVKDPALDGPVTREVRNGSARERFGLRFTWTPGGSAP